MKKSFLGILLLFTILTSLFVTGCSNTPPEELKDYPAEVHSIITNTLINDNLNKFSRGSYSVSGHIILGSEVKDNDTYLYLLASYGAYAVTREGTTKIAGVDAMPAVVVISENEQGSKMSWVEYPPENGDRKEAILSLFPKAYVKRLMKISNQDIGILAAQEAEMLSSLMDAEQNLENTVAE